MRRLGPGVLAAILALWPFPTQADEDTEPDVETVDPYGWVALPGISYSPEDGLTLSAAAIHYWGRSGLGIHPTRLKVTGGVSLRGVGEINVDPDIWFDRGRWNLAITSKLSDVKRKYYGIGRNTLEEAEEAYRATRMSARVEVARRLRRHFFVAGVYDFRYQKITDREDEGSIAAGGLTGSDGGFLSALGVEFRIDTRDSTTFPTRGINLESSPRFYTGLLGSDYEMMRWFTDTSAFFEVRPGHVIAVDSKLEIRYGDIPFDFLSEAGGKRLLRGLLQGRYRDKHYLGAQVEYRFPIYWRFRGVAFAGLGEVASALDEFRPADALLSVGGGLRFALRPEEGIHLRLDGAMVGGSTGVYLNLLEAF